MSSKLFSSDHGGRFVAELLEPTQAKLFRFFTSFMGEAPPFKTSATGKIRSGPAKLAVRLAYTV